MFGSTSCNMASRFLSEIPSDLLDGDEEPFGQVNKNNDYMWTYGNKGASNVKTFKTEPSPKVAASSVNKGFSFGRTAESFLKGLATKSASKAVDLSQYGEGVRVYHKKFGEGVITATEPEGDDLKVDISFDKVGHKRLMAKFANLEVI